MDISKQFQDCIRKKADKTQLKNILFKPPFPVEKDRDILLKASISIVNNIDSLKELWNEHRDAYIDTSKHVSSKSKQMTDRERDDIDNLSLNQIEVCSNSINKLDSLITENYVKKQIINLKNNESNVNSQQDIIREDPSDLYGRTNVSMFDNKTKMYLCMVDQLRQYLSTVSNQFRKQRQFRISTKLKESERFNTSSNNLEQFKNPLSMSGGSTPSTTSQSPLSSSNSLIPSPSATSSLLTGKFNPQQLLLYEEQQQSQYSGYEELELEEDEKLIYEEQNRSLMNELETLADQILTINRQVEELATLFDQMTPHILSQSETIQDIYRTAVDATNFVQRGNEQIHKATQKSFDFRVMVLIFLIVTSFSLLFLNWYQD